MPETYKVLLLPGDGIGPEIMAEAEKVLHALQSQYGVNFETETGLIGGISYDQDGTPLSNNVLDKARNSDAALLGAVGGPKWSDVEYAKRPEAGLLKLRKELDLFANLRPALVMEALIDASTLKADVIRGLDIMIVRELSGGVYFGEPRGIHDQPDGQRVGINTQSYSTNEIHRIADVAFDLARKRNGRVTSCEKSNVMESGLLWREEVTKRHAENGNGVSLDHMYADNCAMQLLKNPRQFDVILTDNLFGDILSDQAAMLTGSLGMLPSASFGKSIEGRPENAVYEPVHGSAPDIAGQGKANPLAMILSLGMMLHYSFNRSDLAKQISGAVEHVLTRGLRTADIASDGCRIVTTAEIGDAVVDALVKQEKPS